MKINTNHKPKSIDGDRYFADLQEQTLYVDADGFLFMKTGDDRSIIFMLKSNGMDADTVEIGSGTGITAPFRKAGKGTFVTIGN